MAADCLQVHKRLNTAEMLDFAPRKSKWFPQDFSFPRGIDFRVLIHAYSVIVEYDTRSKYPEEYSTVK